jgi:dTDP-4-amino-4,6-dideoxygalactose transaminase
MGVVDPTAPQEGRWAADSVSYCPARTMHVRPARRTLYSDRRERFPGLSLPVAQAADERLVTLPLHAGTSSGDVTVVVVCDTIAGASAVE